MSGLERQLTVSGTDRIIHRTLRIGGLAAALLFSTALTAPAFAGGGQSGTNFPASGGDDQLTGPGLPGGHGGGCCGGGGGGAGTTGGQGGLSAAYAPGGAGGSTPGADGAAGSMDGYGYGSGGGGGAHGYVRAALPTSVASGGAGGKGGAGDTSEINDMTAGAGGGGAGGYGAVSVLTGGYLTDELSVSVRGGNGGAGGDSFNGAAGGSGGSGGIGLYLVNNVDDTSRFTISGAMTGGNGGNGGALGGNGGNGGVGLYLLNSSDYRTALTINSAVTGGNGGTAGAGGVVGAGGAGLVVGPAAAGQGVSIVMDTGGSIVGGTDGSGVRADAIQFRNNVSNHLQFNGPTSQLTGNISLSDSSGSSSLSLNTVGTTVVDNAITGNGSIFNVGLGTITLTAANTYVGSTIVLGGTLKVFGAGTLGDAGNATSIAPDGTLDLGGTTQTQNALYLGGGALQNGYLNAPIDSDGGTIKNLGGTASLTTRSGVTTLLGILGYSGATIVNGGTLDVQGTITSTSSVTVNSGGTLMGSGIIDPPFVTINSGGTFMPGNGTPGSSTTIEGSLAFQSGAIYKVLIDPSTASFANVVAGTSSGTATLGGATVNAVFASGGYISKTYTILTTTGGVSGRFASNVVNTNLPANFHTGLSYDANNAYLNLTLNYIPTPTPTGPSAPAFTPLNQNQRNAANAVINVFNAGGAIPIVFGALTPTGLSQASGETSVGSQQTTFDAMNLFMGAMIDPFAGGRSDDVSPSAGGGFSSYAEQHAPRSAYAMFAKAMPVKADALAQRWNVWATGFGGSQTTDGNAVTGSNTSTSRIYGAAVGADYRISPNTLAGFAMSGGGTTFSVANGGSGRSDLFQVGGFLRHTIGTGYLSAALSYAWQDVTTERNVAGIDRLQARFNVNAFSGRLEGGTRYVTPWMGIGATPYAAVQATALDLPAYREQALSGAGAFALNYAARGVTSTRSELGVRTDKSYALTDSILTLRGRFAWAHEFNPDRSAAATFQSVPGTSFVVNGARQASDAALTTASAEMKWRNGFSLAAIFEGEFSDVTRSYAGKGVARYQW